MMKFYLFILSFFTAFNVLGQCPDFTSTITLTSQSLVDAFVADYPNCTELDNALIIGHSGAPVSTDINDLSGLSPLRRVNGTLRVRNVDLLESFEGLDNIEFVEGDLIIGDNELLQNLSDFSHIDSIGGDFEVYSNPNLEQFFQLDSIIYVGESLKIRNNNKLTEITGFNELQSIGENLEISDNELLLSTQGFGNLEEINGTLDIFFSPNLENLNGFDRLTIVRDGMEVRGTGIEDLTGLNNLEIINGKLQGNSVSITDNVNLISLSGLESLDSIQRSLFLTGNLALETIEALSNLKYIGGRLSINNSNLTEISLTDLAPIGSTVEIRENPNLITVDDLPMASTINGSLEISENNNLVSIAGVSTIDSLLGSLRIQKNSSLSDCTSLCPLLRNGYVESFISISENLGSCQTEDILTLACTTSTEDQDAIELVKLFPNPMENILSIEAFMNIQKATIYRADGSVDAIHKYSDNPNQIKLDLSDIDSGLYYLELLVDGNKLVRKFVKI